MTQTVRCAGLVLAAGAGRRLGEPKALVEIGGERLVDRAVALLRNSGADPVYVVVGAATVGAVDASVVPNDEWRTGLASSLRAGLAAVAADDQCVPPVDAAVIVLVDQPDLTPDSIRAVQAAAAEGARIAVATYDGQRDHPVLIRRADWAEAASLALGDAGARAFLAKHVADVVAVPCGHPASVADIDTPEDLAAARERFRSRLR